MTTIELMPRGKKLKYTVVRCDVLLNHLKVHCDTLKLYPVNSKANTKITCRVIINKPTNEMKWNF